MSNVKIPNIVGEGFEINTPSDKASSTRFTHTVNVKFYCNGHKHIFSSFADVRYDLTSWKLIDMKKSIEDQFSKSLPRCKKPQINKLSVKPIDTRTTVTCSRNKDDGEYFI